MFVNFYKKQVNHHFKEHIHWKTPQRLQCTLFQKQTLQKTYKSAEKDTADLNRKLNNLNQYLNRNPEPQTVDKKEEKSHNSL